MKKKNEIFRWIIVVLCGFEVFRLTRTIISTITNYKEQLEIVSGESEIIKNIKLATPIQIISDIILIVTFLLVIYYFIFCFGKQIRTKLLGSAVLAQAVCTVPLFVRSIVMNYSLFLESVDDGGTFYLLSGISSLLEYLVKFVALLLVSIAIFKNIQHNKSVKIICIVLFVLYIILNILHFVSIFMFYYTFSDNSANIMSVLYSQINIMTVLQVFVDLYILLYVFFMDKNYKREKPIEM